MKVHSGAIVLQVRREVTLSSKARRSGSAIAVLVVISIGALITLSAAWTSRELNRRNEHRLLELQTRQAGAVLTATIVEIVSPLQDALHIAEVTADDPVQFSKTMSGEIGPKGHFASAALWKAQGALARQLTEVGESPGLPAGSPAAIAFVRGALHSRSFAVTSIDVAGVQRIAYAVADRTNPVFIVYAERRIPANRQVPVESNPAFADLDYATYVGKTTELSALATTDVPTNKLPLSGNTARDVVPFGDTSITLVASPRTSLGGSLGRQLPWISLAAGTVLTTATAAAAAQLIRRRRAAEEDAGTIARLYREVDGLYTDQRSIAEALQRAMLPATNPAIPGLEIATSYVAGAAGVDIGGDWYSIVPLDERKFAFVVGDVSGRGVSAATIMARLRFTLRAYLVEGHGRRPCSRCARDRWTSASTGISRPCWWESVTSTIVRSPLRTPDTSNR